MERFPFKKIISICLVVLPVTYGIWLNIQFSWFRPQPIKVVLVAPLSGDFAGDYRPQYDMATFALEELNQEGGLLGSPLEIVTLDSQSNPDAASDQIEQLIIKQKPALIVAMVQSKTLRKIQAAMYKHAVPVIYPLSYEGCLQADNLLVTGMVPNQRILPGLLWALQRQGKNIFLLGNNELTSTVEHTICEQYAQIRGGVIIGKYVAPEDLADYSDLIDKIKASNASMVINTMSMRANKLFLPQLHKRSPDGKHIKMFITNLDAQDIEVLGHECVAGYYVLHSYFSTAESLRNILFLSKIAERFGQHYVISASEERTYMSIKLWKHLVMCAKSTSLAGIQSQLKLHIGVMGLQGALVFDDVTQHLHVSARLAAIGLDGKITVTWDSEQPIIPQPYLAVQPASFWDEQVRTFLAGDES